jgi:hypothetical protein|tara:strand:+ start:15234 stop:15971 length:738 start_codon:yes stop_codon:yes gene_type:complete
MARVSSDTSKVYIDEFDFSGYTNSINLAITNNLPEVTCFGDSGPEFVEGLPSATATINGFFDTTDDGYDEQMWANIGDNTKHYLGLFPGSDASHGDIGYELQAQISGQPRPHEVAGAVLLNCDWTSEGGIYRATSMANEAVAGTGAITNSNKNLGATSANTVFVATIRCTAFNGTTITVRVQESSDDGSGDAYADISGLAATFTAIGVTRVSTTSATEAWKRVNIQTFTGTSMTIFVTCGTESGT